MNFKVNIKPTVYTGLGTSASAMDKFHRVTPAVTCFTISKYGSYFGTIKRRNDSGPEYAYCFNMDVFKRGKHKQNKHFTLYVYKIDLRLLDILGLKIQQNRMNFRIIPNNR